MWHEPIERNAIRTGLRALYGGLDQLLRQEEVPSMGQEAKSTGN
jgi:hypothetical protein